MKNSCPPFKPILLIFLLFLPFCLFLSNAAGDMAEVRVLTPSSPDTLVSSGDHVLIYGTSQANTITIESGAHVEMRHMPGANTIHISAPSEGFTIVRSGSYVTMTGQGTTVKMPATLTSQSIDFANGVTRMLGIVGGQVRLGDQTVGLTAAAIGQAQGTPGPELIKDIIEGTGSSYIRCMRAGNNKLFFFGPDEENPSHEPAKQLWVSDGTEEGTLRMTNFDPSVRKIYIVDADRVASDICFFEVWNYSGQGRVHELWRSDGTVNGTFRLTDLPEYIHDSWSAGGLYYFVPFDDPDHGRELWVSDGSAAGTRMVEDIVPGTWGSNPHLFISANDRLYFVVEDNMWTSDGTSQGTRQVTSFEGTSNRSIKNIIAVNDVIYIVQYRYGGKDLLRHDTNSGQTVLVKTFDGLRTSPLDFAAVGDSLYFLARENKQDGYPIWLWKTDGTPNGTVAVKDITVAGVSYRRRLTNVNGTLFFWGHDEEHGWELWKSDGTPNGTLMVKDIKEGQYDSKLCCFTAVGDTLFFLQEVGFGLGGYLWMSDGTETGTVKTDMTMNTLVCPVVFHGQLYFYGRNKAGEDHGGELYRYNLGN